MELISAGGTGKASGTSQAPLDSLKDVPVAAFCGLGNPAGFRHTIQSCGYNLAGFREFPDHHCYSRADIEALAAWADRLGADGRALHAQGSGQNRPGSSWATSALGHSGGDRVYRRPRRPGIAPASIASTNLILADLSITGYPWHRAVGQT